ncbi:alpha/beta hydrolase fold containing protein [Emticicia oligotrophica DSM 17448]|uniref:Alpha/beta hydrolase fold containing protein n=1 Tax=Emticicia oligotrophica (strain DSM 17448 / CIP 109782 / MTCC 6937 / GPTSA100-15) TaxID=929562 RepID=A0ABN4ATI7_EMTOG|nr:alpha/beta hydrolase [Emticicia oligotrophica]AFK04977.1 alpha/beta hydrolase fold containing protein [Emticicia oligotrophica DSM 17448]
MLKIEESGKAPVNGIEIYFETFGNKSNPALLLIMGLDAQCVIYGESFIKPLVDAGYYVIRFDNRDIGLSTWMNDKWHRSNPYTLEDMAKDSMELLNFLQINKAHIIGVSMGGMIAQHIAIDFPEKVLSLTSIMSSGYTLNPKVFDKYRLKIIVKLLPFLIKRFYFKNKYSNHKITVGSYVATYRLLRGTRFPFDEAYFREVFTESIEVRKGQNPRARYQQFCAIVASGSRLNKLHKIKSPTLIIHGTADPLVHPKHAQIYAPLIPKSNLMMVEGMGHELPKDALTEILPSIIKHISSTGFK